jgi:hypothetical protein
VTDKTKVTLYGLTSDMQALENLLDQATATGEIEGQEEAVGQLQNELTAMLQGKVDNVVYFNEYLEDTIEAASKRIKQLQDLKKTLENKQEGFQKYLLCCLDKLDTAEIRGDLKKIMVKKPTKKVEIEDENLLPVEFVKVTRTVAPMKTEIAKAIKAGQEVPGAKLIDGERSIKLSNLTL